MEKGAGGRRRSSLRSTLTTLKAPPRRVVSSSRTCSGVLRFVVLTRYCSAKRSWVLTDSMRSPFQVESRASNWGGAPGFSSAAPRVQKDSEEKASISRLRSAMRRTATDWTRPAERPLWILAHSSGESL